MSQHLEQDKYDENFRSWREETHQQRLIELELLEESLNDDLLEEEPYEDPEDMGPRQREILRDRRMNTRWQWDNQRRRWDIQRRIRELIRWEREDLEWEWKLKNRERYAVPRFLRSTSNASQEAEQKGNQRPVRPLPREKRNRQHKKRSHKGQAGV